jgi:peptide-methionine (S)-S-oxide reductase
MATETVTLGGGCFWCLEAAFQEVQGVETIESGYSGGSVSNPTYEQICQGNTGHAEVVRIVYHSNVISFETILELFFTIHDPTTLNRQGADTGTQYRSVIFYHDEAQKNTAQEMIQQLEEERVFPSPIVTEVVAAPIFYVAEKYHQNYYRQNPQQGYCQAIISPKINKIREKLKTLKN